jgi:hypothetical protein
MVALVLVFTEYDVEPTRLQGEGEEVVVIDTFPVNVPTPALLTVIV